MTAERKTPTRRQPPVNVAVGFLLEGAFYALEQAGYLLEDARVMYDRKRWPSSFALAVLGREEIGRARIYLRERKAVLSGNTVALQSLKAKVSGRGAHEKKITAAQQTTGVFASSWYWGEPPEPGSPEEKQEFENLQQKRRIVEERQPKEDQRRKLRALYVDPAEGGSYWHRPIAEIAQDEADLMLGQAKLQYMIQRRELLNPSDDPELEAAVKAWQTKPSLPDPH